MNEDLFKRFWLAGMRKCNKKKAKPLFNNLLKRSKDPEVFTTKLVMDIQKRIDSNQLGFDMMHPTTYLNGERWEDEIIQKVTPEVRRPLIERMYDTSHLQHLIGSK